MKSPDFSVLAVNFFFFFFFKNLVLLGREQALTSDSYLRRKDW